MTCTCTCIFRYQQISPLPTNSDDGGDSTEETDGIKDMFGLLNKRQHKDTIEVGLMGEGVNGLLKILFECLPSELEAMILFGEKIDHL